MKSSSGPSFAALLLTCCSITFACYFGSYMRLPVVPLFASGLGADATQIGFINAAFLLTAGLLSVPLGFLSDRLGRRLLILGGLLITATSSFLLYFSTTPQQMVWIYLLFGIGLAAFSPPMMSQVADFSPPTYLGRAYGWYTMALYGGMTLGPATGGLIGHALGLRAVFLVSGILVLLMLLVAAGFLPVSAGTPAERRTTGQTLRELQGLLSNRPLLADLLATLGGCFGFGMFVTFLPLYARQQGVSVGGIGLIFGAQALANSLSRLPSGHLTDRVADRSTLVTIGLAGFAAALAGFGWCRTLFLFTLCAGLMGIAMGAAFTAIGALIADAVPREQRGLAMGGYTTCIYLGMMLSAASMGPVIRLAGFRPGFFIAGGICLVATVAFRAIYRGFAVGCRQEGKDTGR